MSRQIAVRLPEDLVDFVDRLVAGGAAKSRAAVVSRALQRERGARSPSTICTSSPTAGLIPTPTRWRSTRGACRWVSASATHSRRPARHSAASADPHPARRPAPAAQGHCRADHDDGPRPVHRGPRRAGQRTDSILTVPGAALGKQIGYLLPEQEEALTAAIPPHLTSTRLGHPFRVCLGLDVRIVDLARMLGGLTVHLRLSCWDILCGLG